jgi:hypothetical protein
MLAGASGLGTIKESFTLAHSVLAGQSSDVPLIRDLSSSPEVQASQVALREMARKFESSSARDELHRISLEHARGSVALLRAKGTPEELGAFGAWLWNIAQGVAKAAKEGGFLGFGGTEISPPEQAYLAELKSALDLEARTAGG